ncbi:MAG: DUF6364 family protein [Puniceicoccaceae bacterium]
MKVTLTVSVDEDLAERAKAKARREKRSLSSLVEQGLRETDASTSTRVDAWAGRFSMPERDPGDPRLNAIIDKYERTDQP